MTLIFTFLQNSVCTLFICWFVCFAMKLEFQRELPVCWWLGIGERAISKLFWSCLSVVNECPGFNYYSAFRIYQLLEDKTTLSSYQRCHNLMKIWSFWQGGFLPWIEGLVAKYTQKILWKVKNGLVLPKLSATKMLLKWDVSRFCVVCTTVMFSTSLPWLV